MYLLNRVCLCHVNQICEAKWLRHRQPNNMLVLFNHSKWVYQVPWIIKEKKQTELTVVYQGDSIWTNIRLHFDCRVLLKKRRGYCLVLLTVLTMSVFYYRLYSSMFRQGMHDLKVWPGVEGDGGEPTTTPGRTSSSLSEDQMGRLAKVQYQRTEET